VTGEAGPGFGGLLRQLRAEAHLTQEELAEAAQVSQRAVSDLERGINRTARKDTAVLLAGALNLAEPVRGLFVAAARGRAPAAGVLAALQQQAQAASWAAAGGVHGFPAALTSFIGRAGPLREVAGLLSDRRLVTVTGPGGAGKTRLAVQVARQVAGRFADGAWLVELAPVADPVQVAAVVAAALGVREQPGLPAAEALARALARQQVLLVLDNCEHVVGAAADLCAGLLAACDDVRVLATSREPLRVAGEARYRLASLALPDLDDLAEAARAEAVALFADRASHADAHFALDDQTAPAVARLVTRLDGMPLAIELAAAHVEVLGVTGLVTRLDGRLALLAGGDRLAPPRQQSLGAAVAWSYQLLDETERRVFRAVSVFPAGFTLEGAEAIAGEAAGPAVLRLVDCSLLTRHGTGPMAGRGIRCWRRCAATGPGGWPRPGSRTRPPPRWPVMRWGWPRRPQPGCRPGPGSGRPRAGWTPRTPPCGRCWPGAWATTRRWRCGWRSRWAGGGICAAGWPVSARCWPRSPGTPSRAVTSGAQCSSSSPGRQTSRVIWPGHWSISPRCATR
jgi:transcriptional regulator with XRE-family HTH domain